MTAVSICFSTFHILSPEFSPIHLVPSSKVITVSKISEVTLSTTLTSPLESTIFSPLDRVSTSTNGFFGFSFSTESSHLSAAIAAPISTPLQKESCNSSNLVSLNFFNLSFVLTLDSSTIGCLILSSISCASCCKSSTVLLALIPAFILRISALVK